MLRYKSLRPSLSANQKRASVKDALFLLLCFWPPKLFQFISYVIPILQGEGALSHHHDGHGHIAIASIDVSISESIAKVELLLTNRSMMGAAFGRAYPSFDINFSLSTINLRWVPSPRRVSPEYATTLNSIFLPSTFVTSAVALTLSPIFEGFM